MSISIDELHHRLLQARNESRQLYTQLDKIKMKNEDANLLAMSKTVGQLNESVSFGESRSATSKHTSVYTGKNLKNIRILKGHHNKIADVKWSKDSQNILSASQDGYMILWDPSTGLKKNAIVLDNQWVLSCAISPSNSLVASAGLTNNCTIYKIDTENMIQQKTVSIFKGHTCYISEIEFQTDTSIITASGDMTACLWDIPKSKKTNQFSEHLGDILALALPKTGAMQETVFATAGSDGYVLIWDSRVKQSVQKFLVGDTDVGCLQFFGDGNSITSGSDDGVIRLFDMRADCKIADYSLTNQHQTLNSYYAQSPMDYTHSQYSAMTSSMSGIWPQQEAASAHSKDNVFETDGVVSLDLSFSGRLMYACYSNYVCVIWDTLKGEVVGTLDGHTNAITKVKSSPNGFGVLTGSWDETIKLWTPSYL